jgi:hypothetical protein
MHNLLIPNTSYLIPFFANFIVMKAYETLSEAINDLQKRGYTHDFNIEGGCLRCAGLPQPLEPDDFEIDEVYRFEGATDPGDENILYAISATHAGIKGLLVNAYGTYADTLSAELVAKLHKHLERK